MLVITDELTLGVGRKGCLTGARKAEENGGLALLVGVGRAVHRSDALQGKEVVHIGEHTLLHLATIPSVDDNLNLLGEVEHNGGLAVEAELFVVLNFCLRGVEHHEIGLAIVCQLLLGGADEHIFHKVSLPSHLHNEADFQAGVLVCTAEGIHNVEFLVGELLGGNLLELLPSLGSYGFVVVFVLLRGPPYGVLRGLVLNEEFVFGRAAGVDTGHHVHSACLGELAFLVTFKVGIGLILKQLLIGGIVDNFGTLDAILFQIQSSHSVLLCLFYFVDCLLFLN